MLPHDKLDWNLGRLARALESTPDDVAARMERARASLSKAWHHGGGEAGLQTVLADSRRLLHLDANATEALLLAGVALALLDRPEPARRHLDEAATDATAQARTHALWHAAHGLLADNDRDEGEALRCFETACRLMPTSWETHALLGERLTDAAMARGGKGRLAERAMFHLVRALDLKPAPFAAPRLKHALGVLCLQNQRLEAAASLFQSLVDHEAWRAEARYHLGRVAARRGKHKKAILFYRQHLHDTDAREADVSARIGACHLHLREPDRAREACTRALVLDSHHLAARWVLGSSLVAEGRPDDASRILRELLELAPGHGPAFAELVRLRTRDGDVRWLRQALRSEVALYDRLPAGGEPRPAPPDVQTNPRRATSARIDVLVAGLAHTDEDVVDTVLAALDLTTDEGLRFRLWESVLDLLAQTRAPALAEVLSAPGERFSRESGRDALLLARDLPLETLSEGLDVSEEDLRRAAVERHGPADDVSALRTRVAAERTEARAWQALLLLGIASRNTSAGRNLLLRWGQEADDELGLAAKAGLALQGDAAAAADLRAHADAYGLPHLADVALSGQGGPIAPRPARLVRDDDSLTCATCGKRGGQVAHMLTAHNSAAAVCSECVGQIARKRFDLMAEDPTVRCALTGASRLEGATVYVYKGVPLSRSAMHQSLGHDERATVDRFLASA